jgi:hypothetical protein
MSNQSWSAEERRQVVAAGLAPLIVSLAVAGIAFIYAGNEAVFVLVALLPASYATLFFFVLPSLWLLRRFGRETPLSFPVVCGIATFGPWFALYVLLFPAGTSKYSGAPIQVLTVLALPAVFAAVAGVVVYRLGAPGQRGDAA